MVLFVVVAWLVVALLVVATAIGPRRWFTYVTRDIHPDAVEPTGSGYGLRTLRNGIVTVVAAAVAFSVTYDWARVSSEELTDAARDVVSRVPDEDLDQERLRVEVQDRLHREVFVETIESDDLESEGKGWRVTLTDPSATGASDDSEDSDDGQAVACVGVEEGQDGVRSFGVVNSGPC